MRVGVVAGAQGNLDAAREALLLLEDCHKIVHLGDLIGIGPDPKETVTLFLENDVLCLRGAYEEKLGDPHSEHDFWLRDQLGDGLLEKISNFSYRIDNLLPETSFLYWARDWRAFLPPATTPSAKERQRIFRREKARHIFFGRGQKAFRGDGLYHPGSLGLSEISLVSAFSFQWLADDVFHLEERSAFYDPAPVLSRFLEKNIPGMEAFAEGGKD